MGPFTLIVENDRGERLDLTGSSDFVTQYTGLDAPKALLNGNEVAGMDGAMFQSAKLGTRNIVLTITMLRNIVQTRLNLYKYFSTKKKVRLYYTGPERDVYIDGYVESMPVPQFKKATAEVMQISILCYQPLLTDVEETVTTASGTSTTVEYEGRFESGFQTEVEISGAVENPTFNGITILTELESGDELLIDTDNGKKRVMLTRAGETTNIIGYVDDFAVWAELMPGENTLTYSAESGAENIAVTYKYRAKFLGV